MYRDLASDFWLGARRKALARTEEYLIVKLARVLVVLLPWIPAFAQYAGPAILSRGEAPTALKTPQLSFRPFLETAWIYDTGLTGVGVNSQGTLGNTASQGIEFSGGISGVHTWKHTSLGLDYQGSVEHYAKTTYYDGSSQSLLLGVTHQFTRHTSLTLRESAGMFSRNYGLPGLPATVPFDPSTAYVPNTDFFDNRTIYFSTQADFTIQKSARLSFDFGGDGSLTRRRSTALYGVSGVGARADVQYRLTRRSTVGGNYSYTYYSYHGILSNTGLHSFTGTYAIRLTQSLELSAFGGFLRSENLFLQNVPVDPAIAALIGTTMGTIVAHRIDYVPNFSGRLSQTFQRGVAFVSGGHTVAPGNGLFLTSISSAIAGGYTYTGLRRWSFSAQSAYTNSKSIGNVIANYGGTSAGASVSRQIGRYVHAVASFDARQYESPTFSQYNRLIYDTRIGLGFTPGDIPLRLW
jgi:hypothetical protein